MIDELTVAIGYFRGLESSYFHLFSFVCSCVFQLLGMTAHDVICKVGIASVFFLHRAVVHDAVPNKLNTANAKNTGIHRNIFSRNITQYLAYTTARYTDIILSYLLVNLVSLYMCS